MGRSHCSDVITQACTRKFPSTEYCDKSLETGGATSAGLRCPLASVRLLARGLLQCGARRAAEAASLLGCRRRCCDGLGHDGCWALTGCAVSCLRCRAAGEGRGWSGWSGRGDRRSRLSCAAAASHPLLHDPLGVDCVLRRVGRPAGEQHQSTAAHGNSRTRGGVACSRPLPARRTARGSMPCMQDSRAVRRL